MTTESTQPQQLFAQLDEAAASLVQLLSSANEKLFDEAPFENSWTIAQLASHITKSNKAIAQALAMEGKPAERNAEERVEELKQMFMDFTSKYQSPEFLLPSKNNYTKTEIVHKLDDSVTLLQTIRDKINLSEVINLPAFGELTKFELLHFILFHTKRHTHQLKNILNTIQSKN